MDYKKANQLNMNTYMLSSYIEDNTKGVGRVLGARILNSINDFVETIVVEVPLEIEDTPPEIEDVVEDDDNYECEECGEMVIYKNIPQDECWCISYGCMDMSFCKECYKNNVVEEKEETPLERVERRRNEFKLLKEKVKFKSNYERICNIGLTNRVLTTEEINEILIKRGII